jgi:hypothetical protein
MRISVVMTLVAIAAISMVSAQDLDPCPNPVQWTDAPYGDADSTTPAGFRFGIMYEANSPPLCVNVAGTNNKKIDIMAETDRKDARICVRSVESRVGRTAGTVDQCGRGQIRVCVPASTEDGVVDTKLYFYCDEGCESDDVGVHYKMRVSKVAWTDDQTDAETNLDMWCMMLDGNDTTVFPSEIGTEAPDGFEFDIAQQFAPSSASSLYGAVAMLSTAVAMFVLAVLKL